MRYLLVYLLVSVSVVFATEQTGIQDLTLDQALVNVLERNPSLKAADFEARAAAARIRTATQTPAIRTSIEFENFGGSGVLADADALESTLSLSKVLEPGSKARLRGDVARTEAMVLLNEQDAARLDLLAETAKRFVQVVVSQERLAIAKESMALTKQTQQIVELRVNAGKSANAELHRAKIALAKMELAYDHARHGLASSRLQLASLWAQTEAGFNSAKADLFRITTPAAFDSLARRLDDNPDLVRLVTEKRLAQTRIQLQRSARKANVEIAGGLRHFNAIDDTALVMSLNIPLGSRSRAAPGIEEAEWLDQRNPLDLEQRRLELHTTLFEVHQEMIHATDAVRSLRETIIPLAQSALADYEKGYAAGRYSLLELNVAQKTLLDSKLELVEAAADYHRYRIEIDRLTGAGLATGANP